MSEKLQATDETTLIQWTRAFKEPESYGEYLVKGNGVKPTFARFDHPIGCRETGWYISNEQNESGWEQIYPHYWTEIPE